MSQLDSANTTDWDRLTVAEQVEVIRRDLCTGPCGQSEATLRRRTRINATLRAVRNLLNGEAGNTAAPVGTMACPVCGQDSPHAHTTKQVAAWVDAQASRFGYRAHTYLPGKPADEAVTAFVDGTLGQLRHEERMQEAANGRCDEWVENAIRAIEILAGRNDR